MKVRCLKDKSDGATHSLTIGEMYEVIAIEAGDYRILDDTGGPYLFPPECFTLVDAKRPAHWRTETVDGAEYAAAPELSGPGFFEDYFEGKPDAVRAFARYVNRHLRLTDAA